MTNLEQFKEDFKDLPPILYELLIKHYNLNQTGCIDRAYKEFYVLMKDKECSLLDFYNLDDLENLRVEPEIDCVIEFSKEYFLLERFIFENVSSNEMLTFFKNKDVYFYIRQDPGSGGNYSCCASIVLRYKNT